MTPTPTDRITLAGGTAVLAVEGDALERLTAENEELRRVNSCLENEAKMLRAEPAMWAEVVQKGEEDYRALHDANAELSDALEAAEARNRQLVAVLSNLAMRAHYYICGTRLRYRVCPNPTCREARALVEEGRS